MRFVTRSTAATLWMDLPDRADATPTFVVKYPLGGEAQASASVTLGTCNTTLSGAASAGAQSVTVASATGIVVGRKYLIGGSESVGGERVTVKSIASTTITLVRPLRTAKASGATFASTRVDLAVLAASVPTIGRHYRAEITWAVGAVAQPTAFLPFDVVRYQPMTGLEFDDIADLDPVLAKRIPVGAWMPSFVDAAWDMILARLAQTHAPGSLMGAIDLTIPHGYLVRRLIAESGGAEWVEYADRMGAKFQQEFEVALASAAVDDDQDGAIEPHEGWTKTVRLDRG